MLKQIHPSVKKWALAFLLTDLAFWLWIGYGCVTDSEMCVVASTFAAFFYYLPFSFVLGFFGTIPSMLLGVVAHMLLGSAIGWLLRNYNIRWWIVGLVTVAIAFSLTMGLGTLLSNQELARETKTQLWTINKATTQEINYTVSGEEGSGAIYLDSYDTSRTRVELSMHCDASVCSFASDDMDTISYEAFLATMPTFPLVFEVTSNPQAIISMRQVPTNLTNY